MEKSNIVNKVHELAITNHKYEIAIDATLGNGYDTLFLSKHYNKVIGLDIQELAIKRSKTKLNGIDNVELFLDDFNNIGKYKYANLIIFNLGFLPGSNKKVKTQDYTSHNAIIEAYKIIDGTILIACYVQHEGGYDEYLKIIETLNIFNIEYTILDEFDNKEKLIVIRKSL